MYEMDVAATVLEQDRMTAATAHSLLTDNIVSECTENGLKNGGQYPI